MKNNIDNIKKKGIATIVLSILAFLFLYVLVTGLISFLVVTLFSIWSITLPLMKVFYSTVIVSLLLPLLTVYKD